MNCPLKGGGGRRPPTPPLKSATDSINSYDKNYDLHTKGGVGDVCSLCLVSSFRDSREMK